MVSRWMMRWMQAKGWIQARRRMVVVEGMER
jgi:hypothetical protein